MTRRSFTTTPLIEAYLDQVKASITFAGMGEITTAEALEWLLLDIGMYPEDVPAYGCLSPAARMVLVKAYAKVGGKPGDMDDKNRPYRGVLRERTHPR